MMWKKVFFADTSFLFFINLKKYLLPFVVGLAYW